MSLKVLSTREAAIFESLADTYCSPGGEFPPVEQTDAVGFIDELASRAPLRNRLGFRVLLTFADTFPLARGYRRRFRRLDRQRRAEYLRGLDKSRFAALAIPGRLLKMLTMMAYYGDDGALRAAGYDPDVKLARARELRHREGRK